jgi:hypothetical protein
MDLALKDLLVIKRSTFICKNFIEEIISKVNLER